MIPAGMLILPRIPKAAPGIEMITPPQSIIARGAVGFEIGDAVYWDSNDGCLKACGLDYPPKGYQRVFGYVSRKETDLSNGSTEIDIRGIG